MAFELMPLPYPKDALAPAISAETLGYHHGKHHKAYVDKTNKAIEGGDLDGADLETVIARARGRDQGLFNNAAQAWNHGFYWHSLAPAPSRPAGELLRWIETAFGSLEALEKELAARGAGHFSNGWVWLARGNGSLSIEETHDGDTLADRDLLPLLTIDLWEHAYYLDHQNDRKGFLEAWFDALPNWGLAESQLRAARGEGEKWRHPAPR
jgi:Fe-Mn family superoxide dismutase